MSGWRHLGGVLLGLTIAAQTFAQTNDSPPSGQGDAARLWSFAVTVAGYIVPHDRSYASPTFSGDRKHLHVEARYNYEDAETGSLWAGYNFSSGKNFTLEFTPMIGGVFGNTTGFAPGYNFMLAHKNIELSSQSEFVVSLKESSNSFFYTWSELSYSPTDWLRAGFVAQRTKAYHTELDIQRGILLGFSRKRVDFTTYVFNVGWTDPTVVLSLGFTF